MTFYQVASNNDIRVLARGSKIQSICIGSRTGSFNRHYPSLLVPSQYLFQNYFKSLQ